MLEGRKKERKKKRKAEAHTALHQMKNDKGPGSDGFTIEFNQVFWNDTGKLLVKSVNYGFTHVEICVTQSQGLSRVFPKRVNQNSC